MPRRLVTIAVCLLIIPMAAAAAGNGVRFAPAPSWIAPAAVDANAPPPAGARWGIYALLSDHQVRASASGTTEYFRHVRKVLSAAGVQNASELELDFDPSFQQLILHSVTVVRGSERIDALDRGSLRVIEKEDSSGDHLYDGLLTAIVFIDDVRPGDVLDYAWSLEGANPLLGGRFADTLDLTAEVPTRLIRQRVVVPGDVALHVRAATPQGRQASGAAFTSATVPGTGEREYLWTRSDVAPVDSEDRTPDWFDPYHHIEVSEFASWHDVALWADALFQVDDESREAVRRVAAKIRSEHPARAAQVVAAIRFVQDDIRYLGIELGRSSHEPHQPADVLDQRWGDCKDKSLLLATLLRELGVDAWPALVNTRMRRSLDAVLPSPFAFDHVITAVDDRGTIRWIDATLANQGGTLETIETPNDERALVIRKESAALTPIRTNEKGSTTIDRTYVSRTWEGPATLTVTSRYRGGDADLLRDEVATMSPADVARQRINRLAADMPKIAATAPLRIDDDRDGNQIVIVEKYAVRDLWKGGELGYSPHAVIDHLSAPETVLRNSPLALDFPLNVTEHARFLVPDTLEIDRGASTVETAAFRFESRVERWGNEVSVTSSLRTKKDAVDAREVPDFLSAANELTDSAAVTLRRREPMLASVSGRISRPAIGLLALLFAAVAAFAIWRRAEG